MRSASQGGEGGQKVDSLQEARQQERHHQLQATSLLISYYYAGGRKDIDYR